MKKILLFLFSLLIGFCLFVWIIRIVGWQEIKNAFLISTGWQGMVILALTILAALVGTWKWKEILKGEGVGISFKSLLEPYLAGFAIMFLVPIMVFGGEIFRTYVLKEKNSIPWSKGMASVIIDRILEWTANLTVIFFGILFFLYEICFPPKNLGLAFGVVLIVFVTGVSYFYFKVFRKESILKILSSWLGLKVLEEKGSLVEIEREIFNFFKPKRKQMWKAFSLSFLRAAVMYLRVFLLIIFLGKSIGGLPVLSVLGFTYLAALIPIPAALGSHEAIQIFAFNSLGLGSFAAAAFTMIIRGAELIISLVGIVILFRLGTGLLKSLLSKKISNLGIQNSKE